MKFKCKQKNYETWHEHFAWLPIHIADNDCRWLETVMRKGELCIYGSDGWWTWEYKAKENT